MGESRGVELTVWPEASFPYAPSHGARPRRAASARCCRPGSAGPSWSARTLVACAAELAKRSLRTAARAGGDQRLLGRLDHGRQRADLGLTEAIGRHVGEGELAEVAQIAFAIRNEISGQPTRKPIE